ncbi:ABC transporter substrate-binding protein [Halalkalibacillus halophilus]|uniref:ABC transporter substrate-binding protein n=1 Tax=Halalkalibacillus halophilus TaxID=392827 RepID=UPI000408D25A|nr:ABC transporter substrate-binding protein [Halalkalibacillus halophilus]
MNKQKWLLFLLAGLLIFVLAACGAGDEEDETSAENEDDTEETEQTEDTEAESQEEEASNDGQVISMGTSADFPPFESFDESGEFVGFDIDLANMIAEELGYELEIQDMNFDGLIGALQSGRVDMVLAGMSATEERQENVNFSTPYHHSGEMFVTQPDSDVQEMEDLEGQTVGVQLGTIQEEGARQLQEEYDFELKQVDEATNLIQEIMTNRIDVAYMDKTVAEGYIEEQDLTGFDDTSSAAPGMAVAFPKDSEIHEEVSEIIEQFLDDGTIAELEEKWELDEE